MRLFVQFSRHRSSLSNALTAGCPRHRRPGNLLVTLAAVNRLVTMRHERDLRELPARGTRGRVHLAWRAPAETRSGAVSHVAAVRWRLGPSRSAAVRTAAWRVEEAPAGVKRLLSGGECELSST